MAGPTQTSFFRQKQVLKEEEKSLVQMLDKFNDQLRRLKIEELALISTMKMQNSAESTKPYPPREVNQTKPFDTASNISSISSIIPVGTVERAASINEETLDLRVDSSFMRQVMTVGNLDENEAMEEYESESEDCLEELML